VAGKAGCWRSCIAAAGRRSRDPLPGDRGVHHRQKAEAAKLLPPQWKQELATSGYDRDAILPLSVPEEDLNKLLFAGLIESVEEPA
jgi:hypothetical protein